MISLFLFSLFGQAEVFVFGEYPLSINDLKNHSSDIAVVDSTLIHDFIHMQNNRQPMKKQCILTCQFHPFSIIEGDKSSEIDFSISSDYQSKRSLVLYLTRNLSFSAVLSDNYPSKYRIISYTNDSDTISLHHDPYYHNIYFGQSDFYIFSSSSKLKICQNNSFLSNNNFTFQYLFIFSLIILFLAFIISITLFKIPIQKTNIWRCKLRDISHQTNPFKSIEPKDYEIIKRSIQKSITSKQSMNAVIRAKRQGFTVHYQCMTCLILEDGTLFVFTYIEKPSAFNKDEIGKSLNIEFESDTIDVKSLPQFKFVSYRNMSPAFVNFTLSYNSTGNIGIPEDLLASYAKTGQAISSIMMMGNTIGKLLKRNMFSLHNIQKSIKKLCKITNATCALCFEDDILIYKNFSKNNTTDEQAAELTDEEIMKIPSKLKKGYLHYMAKNLIPGYEMCFVNSVCDHWHNTHFIIGYQHAIDAEALERTAAATNLNFCLFAYDASIAKEQCLKFSNFMKLLSSCSLFSFIEFSQDLKRLIYLNTPTSELKSCDLSFSELSACHFPLNESEMQNMINLIKAKGTMISQEIIDYNDHILAVSLSRSIDHNYNQEIISMLTEDITDMSMQEKFHREELDDVERASEMLNLHKFTVKEDGVFLDDDSLFRSLGVQPDPENSLAKLLSPTDIEKLDLLKQPTRFSTALINSENKTVWYSAMSDGTFGFLFCVNEYVDTHENKMQQPLTQMTYSNGMWAIEPNTHKVMKLYEMPTIWDILTVDKTTEFGKFANFVHPSERDLFTTNYSNITGKKISTWSANLRLLKLGGVYQWYSLFFIRAKNDRIYCLAININTVHTKELEIEESFIQKDKLFKELGVMVWKFEDSHQKISSYTSYMKAYNKYTFFNAGLSTYLKTNWWFVNTFMDQNDLPIFTEKMKKALRHSSEIECYVTFHFEKPYHVVLLGKASSIVIGFCINVEEIDNEKETLESEIAAFTNLHKTAIETNKNACLSNIRSMDCIYAILDVIASKAFNNNQIWTIELTRTMIDILISKTTDDLIPINYINKIIKNHDSDVTFNMLDVLEQFMQIIYLYCQSKQIGLEIELEGTFPETVIGSVPMFKLFLFSYINFVLEIFLSCSENPEEPHVNNTSGTYIKKSESSIQPVMKSLPSIIELPKNRPSTPNHKKDEYMLLNSNILHRSSNNLLESLQSEPQYPNLYLKFTWEFDKLNFESFKINANVMAGLEDTGIPNSLLALFDANFDIDSMTMTKKMHAISYPIFHYDFSGLKPLENPGMFINSTKLKDTAKSQYAASASTVIRQVMIHESASAVPMLTSMATIPSTSSTLQNLLSSVKGKRYLNTYAICLEDPFITNQIVQQLDLYSYTYMVVSSKEELVTDILNKQISIVAFFVDSYDVKKLIEQFSANPHVYMIGEPSAIQQNEPTVILKPLVSSQIRKIITSPNKFPSLNLFKPSIHVEEIVRSVLLVEDDFSEQFAISKLLETIKCKYVIAISGEDAIKALDEKTFDIVIMECQLPVLDGFETTKMIRKLLKRYAPIPIVGISADETLREASLESGMNAFYPKPLRLQSIKDALIRFAKI